MTAPSLVIRPATEADLPAIVALLADDVLGRTREDPRQPLDPAYLSAFRAIAADPNQIQLVADAAGQILGTLQLTIIPGLSRKGRIRGQIEGVRIAGAARGQGLGETLIRHAIGLAADRGCSLVQLTTDLTRKDAHRFYERLGFTGSHLGMKLEI